jgi:peptidoglycan hydrolase CwlO-like protein
MNNITGLVIVGLVLGLLVGGGITWYLVQDFANNAVVEAELYFNDLLETEKGKFNEELASFENTKEDLESTLIATQGKVDSLNTTIENRGKELKKIKRKYNEKISSIDGMSHNELTEFFAKRYGN